DRCDRAGGVSRRGRTGLPRRRALEARGSVEVDVALDVGGVGMHQVGGDEPAVAELPLDAEGRLLRLRVVQLVVVAGELREVEEPAVEGPAAGLDGDVPRRQDGPRREGRERLERGREAELPRRGAEVEEAGRAVELPPGHDVGADLRVVDAPAAADRGAAVLAQAPGEAQARGQ